VSTTSFSKDGGSNSNNGKGFMNMGHQVCIYDGTVYIMLFAIVNIQGFTREPTCEVGSTTQTKAFLQSLSTFGF